MAGNRKLGRPSDQRKAILRNMTTALIWNGKLETTETRAKEVAAITEKLITLAMDTYNKTQEVTKERKTSGGTTSLTVINDAPEKLAARRKIMAWVYDVPEKRNNKESKYDYNKRTKDNSHPVVEKLFRELAPKYDKRRQDVKQSGGYTRIIRKGPRRGDAAEMVLLELV